MKGGAMQEIPIVLGFTAGELSPWLDSRLDLQAYQRGAALMSNFTILPYGGIRRRRGAEYVGHAASQIPGATRLFPFRYSEEDVLMLEFSPGCMRVYREGRLLYADGEPYMLMVPWDTAARIRKLRITQVNDTLYATCGDYPVVMLSRHGDTDWSCEEPELDPYPRENYAAQANVLQIRLSQDGGTAELHQMRPYRRPFTTRMEGREILLADVEDPGYTLFKNQTFSPNASAPPNLASAILTSGAVFYVTDAATGMRVYYTCISDYVAAIHYTGSNDPAAYPLFFSPGVMIMPSGKPYEVGGDWELQTYGEWNAAWELRRSYDTVEEHGIYYRLWNWETVKTFSQDAYSERKNWALTGSEKEPCRMVLVLMASSGAQVAPMLSFQSLGGVREYKMRIDSVSGQADARATVLKRHLSDSSYLSTTSWSFGAFGERCGYPAFSSYYQNRLWFSGVRGLPTTLFGSCTDDFTSFRVGSDADDALHLTLASDDQSRICWMCATRELLVGTAEGEWALVASDNGALSATSAAYRRQSAVGSEDIPVHAVENTVLFVQRGGKRLREISYKLESDGFSSVDLSLMAEHLLRSGVREWCVQRGTDTYIWLLMRDDSLAVLTMNMEQQVTAWQRVELPGRCILHLAALPGTAGTEDEIWFVTQGTATGAVMLERIRADETVFADLCCTLRPAADGTFTGAEILANQAARVWRTGKPADSRAVQVDAEGCGTIPADFLEPGAGYTLGLPYCSELRTMPLERELSFNSVRQLSRMRLRLLESDPHFRYKSTASPRWEEFSGPETIREQAPFTGSVRLPQMPDAAVGQSMHLAYDGLLDFCLLAITVEVDHHGK